MPTISAGANRALWCLNAGEDQGYIRSGSGGAAGLLPRAQGPPRETAAQGSRAAQVHHSQSPSLLHSTPPRQGPKGSMELTRLLRQTVLRKTEENPPLFSFGRSGAEVAALLQQLLEQLTALDKLGKDDRKARFSPKS